MKIATAFLAAATVLLPSVHAVAAPTGWQLVTAEAAQAVFYQPKSVNLIPDGLEVSVLEDFRNTEYLGEPVFPHKSRLSTFRVDCERSEAGLVSWTLYDANFGQGEVVWSDKAEEVSMFRAASEPAVERLVQRVCAPFVARR
jgi:hypothetical protein